MKEEARKIAATIKDEWDDTDIQVTVLSRAFKLVHGYELNIEEMPEEFEDIWHHPLYEELLSLVVDIIQDRKQSISMSK